MIDQLVEIGNAIWAWFGDEDHQNRVTAIAAAITAAIALAGIPGGVIWYYLTRRKTTPPEPTLPSGSVLTMDQHLTILQKREDQLQAKLATAHQDEKDLLRRQIAELKAQIAKPEESLAEARKRIADLEARLDREGNHIGGDRIAEAKTALEQGDYSIADDIFAEIEARNELAVQDTARAAYGRGEVAEAEVRWHDAAEHYATAARLDPGYVSLFKAREYAWRSGKLDVAHRHGEDLVAFARKEGTQEQIAKALNEHAVTTQSQGRSEEAEGLLREAMEIDRATIGDGHPDYVIGLSNLAGVLKDQGRYEEAEILIREALELGRVIFGEAHPSYAIGLNNLASVLQDQGRPAEAETLFREALEIDRATIGERHPEFATSLNNLAGVVQDQGRHAEAETLYREALKIDRAMFDEPHPYQAIRLSNLAGAIRAQGRFAEAEELYRDALEVGRVTIGEGHPNYAISLNNLARTLVDLDRPAEARPLYERALEILRETLPPDHPVTGVVERRLAALPDD